jgi:hypothetical protein
MVQRGKQLHNRFENTLLSLFKMIKNPLTYKFNAHDDGSADELM